MRMLRWLCLLAAATIGGFGTARGLTTPPHSELEVTRFGVVITAPGVDKVRVRPDVVYLRDARDTLTVDLYLPADLKAGERRPAVVFLNAIGETPGAMKVKHWEIYRTWPRLVAAHGMIGVSMEAERERIPECLRAVFEFLATRGSEHGVDGARLGCYAASANVTQASQYLLGDSAHAGIRAAVLYYGRPPEREPRADLPVLFVVPEGDAARMAEPLTALWSRVVAAKAPWELVYASRLPHAFDAVSDDEPSRRLVGRTLDFWRAHLEPAPAVAEPPSEAREVVETLFWNDRQRSEAVLAAWLAKHPDDAKAWTLRAGTLADLRRHDEAVAAYEKARTLGQDEREIWPGLAQIRLRQQRWSEALELLERVIVSGPASSLHLGQLAWAQLQMGRNQEAVRSYERAFAAGIPPGATTRGVAWYNLACAHARLGEHERALDALARAVENGHADRAGAEKDPDLASLRNHPRWRGILDVMGSPAAARSDAQ
jgi:tetratricopeptide (TPR) repeat protein